MKVLVVENNPSSLKLLTDFLEKEGLECIEAQNGQDALKIYHQEKPDFICLDIIMDDMSGYDVCKAIRKEDSTTPIIFISTKSETVDKIIGLEIGADDYIVKPFDFKEVAARIRAVTRRCLASNDHARNDEDQSFKVHDLTVFSQELVARREQQTIDLSLRDIKILKLLKKKKNQVIDRNMLLDFCWGRHIMPESRTVDWHISQLRKKIEKDPQNPEIIQTVHGVGYRYIETGDEKGTA